ncbi:DoxX family protein [Nocardia sp. NBC_01388]|uniref:DoxX family protein n=1 Tax=Nocardia sp. NBC_01388 TaxID=2903596 RepID=UPI00324BA92B
MTTVDSTSIDAGLLLLRTVAGLTMAAHGYQKFYAGGRIAGTGRWFDSIGMRPGRWHALLAATTEVAAGIMLALGLLTSLAGAAFIALMLVAAYTVHRSNGFFSVKSGWEYNFVLAVIGAALAITGAGRFSLDHVAGWTSVFSGSTGALIGVVGGLAAGIAQLAVFYRPTVPAVAAE